MGSRKPKVNEENKLKEEDPKKEKKKQIVRHDTPEFIIRVVGTDLDGEKPIFLALKKIKGIGDMFSNAVCKIANINPNTKLKDLSDDSLKTLEDAIKNPIKFGMPAFLANRQKDPETGGNMHLTSSDLEISKRFDVQKYINLRSYRGWRHMFGQPVRGQRTRSTFREKGKSVGVVRKALKAQQQPQPRQEKK